MKTADINSRELVTAIEAARGAIRKDTITPIFQAIRVRVSDGEVSVLANNYEASVRAIREISGDGSQTIDAIVKFESFLDSVKSMAGTIGLRETKEYLILESGKNSIRSKRIDGEIVDPDLSGSVIGAFTVDAAEWKRAIERVSIAIDKKSQNPALVGIHITVFSGGGAGDLAIVEGANTLSIGRVWIPVEVNIAPVDGGKFEFLIPGDQAENISRLFHNTEKWVVSVRENGVSFSGDNVEATTGIITESYPDVSSVIPTPNRYRVAVNRNSFSRALKRARIFSESGENKRIRLSVFRDETGIRMRVSGSGSFGNTAEDLDVDDFETLSSGDLAKESGGFYHIYFDSGLLEKIIKVSRGEKIVFEFSASTTGAIFSEFENKDEWIAVLAPMFVTERE